MYTDRDWARFFAMIDRPDLADDPRYATLHSRTQHVDELYGLVAEHLATDTTAVWFTRFREAAIPAAPYNSVDDVFTDEHFLAVGLFEEVDHPTEGRLLQCVTPITIDGERVGNDGPAPDARCRHRRGVRRAQPPTLKRSPSTMTSRPHHSSTGHLGGERGVVVAGDDARAVGRGRDDRGVPRLTTFVRDRVPVDRRPTPMVADHLERGRPGFHRGAGVVEREPAARAASSTTPRCRAW